MRVKSVIVRHENVTHRYEPPRTYGFFRFLWDCILVLCTCGFWLIWIFVREMRRR